MAAEVRFVTGERAVMIGSTMAVSDFHVGVEYRFRKDGISVPSQSGRMLERLEGLINKEKARRLVVLGDVKDAVPGKSFQEEREIPAMFRRLLEIVEVEVTPGNHDTGIVDMLPPEVGLHSSTGFMLDGVWLCHGHAWPPEEFLGAGQVVIGHQHAGIDFRDKLGYRWTEPVWIRAGLDRKRVARKYKSLGKGAGKGPGKEGRELPELVIMPIFNEFAFSIGANRPMKEMEKYYTGGNELSPLFRAARRDSAKVYMLDGTLLGELGKL